jgi:hypothetical protein
MSGPPTGAFGADGRLTLSFIVAFTEVHWFLRMLKEERE